MNDRILKLFLTLPHSIDYVGYRFQLIIYDCPQNGPTVAYFLSQCLGKKPKYKKTAFDSGYWWDKNHNRHNSLTGTKFFIKHPIFDESDEGLSSELEAIKMKLELWRILEPTPDVPISAHEEITDIPNEGGKTLIQVFEDAGFFEKDEFERYASI